jgi:hypothetical protein
MSSASPRPHRFTRSALARRLPDGPLLIVAAFHKAIASHVA